MYKMASISLCSNLDGQLTMGLMVQPPVEGEPSYKQYIEEKTNFGEKCSKKMYTRAAWYSF